MLHAIQRNPALNFRQKLILLTIAGELNVSGDFLEERWIYSDRLIELSSIPRSTFYKELVTLEEAGYVHRRPVNDKNIPNRRLASYYSLKKKLFDEYKEILKLRLVQSPPETESQDSVSPGDRPVSPRDCNPDFSLSQRQLTNPSKANPITITAGPSGPGVDRNRVASLLTRMTKKTGKEWEEVSKRQLVDEILKRGLEPILKQYELDLKLWPSLPYPRPSSILMALVNRQRCSGYLEEGHSAYARMLHQAQYADMSFEVRD